jgi:hypothetical protein
MNVWNRSSLQINVLIFRLIFSCVLKILRANLCKIFLSWRVRLIESLTIIHLEFLWRPLRTVTLAGSLLICPSLHKNFLVIEPSHLPELSLLATCHSTCLRVSDILTRIIHHVKILFLLGQVTIRSSVERLLSGWRNVWICILSTSASALTSNSSSLTWRFFVALSDGWSSLWNIACFAHSEN